MDIATIPTAHLLTVSQVPRAVLDIAEVRIRRIALIPAAVAITPTLTAVALLITRHRALTVAVAVVLAALVPLEVVAAEDATDSIK